MKSEIVSLLAGELKGKVTKEEIERLIEIPPSDDLGDFAFPCFSLAKIEKKSPLAIAEDIAERIRKKKLGIVSNVDVKGGYVNFFIDKKTIAEGVLKDVFSKNFGMNDSGKGKKIVIDMSSPNIAKPFGIGHLRSTIIGNSIARISEYNGYKPVKINYLGDWGTQFGKLIVGFKKWGSETKLKKDPIKHLLEIYVKANSEEYEQEARDWFKKLENGDKEALGLWKKFRELSLKEFNEIYGLLNVKFDVISGESKYNDKMQAVVDELKKKKLLKESEGAQIVDLNEYNLGVALIQKSDGASLYATRDLTAAIDRYKTYKFEKMIYEVGQEQTLHFKQVFKILDLMGYKWSENCKHVSHGLYLDEEGKKFSTRKGKTVFMKDILDETVELARKELLKREKLSEKEANKRAIKIALSAIVYGDLKNYRENNVIFDIDRFLQFEGDTGPYLLYSYARASSIIRKVKSSKDAKIKIVDLKQEEVRLLKKIADFSVVVEKAYKEFAPNLIANYCYELSGLFNEFYHACPVIGSDEQAFRLKLVDAFRVTIKKGLSLLGIDVLEEM